MALHHPGVVTTSILSVTSDATTFEEDELSVEEPLEVAVRLLHDSEHLDRSVAVTMRTPGNDIELAAGFLFTEGILHDENDIADIQVTEQNHVVVTMQPTVRVDLERLDRNSFVSSSCGVCGKRSIAAVFAVQRHRIQPGSPRIDATTIYGLLQTQRVAQDNFRRTGGLHAAALFNSAGQLLSLFEDVGRHNALDKLIGAQFLSGRLPLRDRILLVSGRASFELVQKAAMAGIPILAAVGAPSSLAVTLARQTAMTLLGFVRDDRFNLYADSSRLEGAAGGSSAGMISTSFSEWEQTKSNGSSVSSTPAE